MATAIIIDDNKQKLRRIETSDYCQTKISYKLPFRIRFTTITIEGYGPNNVPPIPLQVIGFSNYIL
jgi:hypothetical protein